jgi:hypothetical protein
VPASLLGRGEMPEEAGFLPVRRTAGARRRPSPLKGEMAGPRSSPREGTFKRAAPPDVGPRVYAFRRRLSILHRSQLWRNGMTPAEHFAPVVLEAAPRRCGKKGGR